MEHSEQLIIVNKLILALTEANYWANCVPHNTVRNLSPELVSKLCTELKDLSRYSKGVRTLAFEENLFQNEEEEKNEQ